MTNVIPKLQELLYNQNGIETDFHYKEGRGVIFVPAGFEPLARNIVASYTENEMRVVELI